MELSKWVAVSGAVWIMLVSGGGYNFGLYSETIKHSLRYSQHAISTIAFFRDIGANFGICCGIMYDHVGARAVLAVGAFFNFVGYFFLWMIVERKVPNPGMSVVCMLFFFSANSQAFGFTCAMITSVKNFPENRGIVIGVVTGFIGLSGAVLAIVFQAAYVDTRFYLLFNAWFTSGVFLLCMPLMMQVVENVGNLNKKQRKIFNMFSVLCFSIALYLLCFILLKVLLHVSRPMHCVLTAIMLLCVLVTPILLTKYATACRAQKDAEQIEDQADAHNEENHVEAENEASEIKVEVGVRVTENENDAKARCQKPKRGDNFTLWQATRSLDMWTIFVISSCGLGSVLAALDNLGQIGTAWGNSTHQITNSVAFTSIWNFLGRIGAGYISEILIQRYGTPRPLVFAVVLVIAACGHLVIALRPPLALFLAAAIEGFALGAQLTLIFAMTSELFGLQSFATLYSFGSSVSTAIGTYLLSVLLAGNLFDKEAQKQHTSPICHGIACYQKSFLIMVGVCVFGTSMSGILALRTREFYKRLQKHVSL